MTTSESNPVSKRRNVGLYLGVMVAALALATIAGFVYFRSSQNNNLANFQYHLPISDQRADAQLHLGDLEKRIQLDPHDGLSAGGAAELALLIWKRTGDNSYLDQAISLAKRSISIEPKMAIPAQVVLAQVAENQHQFKDAITAAHKIIAGSSKTLEARKIVVTANLAVGDLTAAMAAADQLVETWPKTGTLSLRGVVLFGQGRDDEGLFDLQHALHVEDLGESPDSTWARCVLGRYFLRHGKLDQAEYLFDESLRISPHFPLALDLLGQLKAAKSDNASAEKLFDDAFNLSRQVVYLRHAAELNFASNKKQLALDRWQQAEKLVRADLASGLFGHRLELARVLLVRRQNGDLKEAVQLIHQELTLRKDSETYYLLAEALNASGELEPAIEAAQSSLRSGVRDPEYYRFASELYKKSGNEGRFQFYRQLALNQNSSVSTQPFFH